MPLYEFSCKHCDRVFEEIVPMDTDKRKCNQCGNIARKIISSSNFRIEGYSEANGYSKNMKDKKKC